MTVSDLDHSRLLAPFLSLADGYVVLDTETTDIIKDGVLPDILSLGMVRVDHEGVISNPVEFKVRPDKPIHPLAEKVHGISEVQAATFPSFASQWEQIRKWLDGSTIVIHNADFDWPILLDHVSRGALKMPAQGRVFCSQKSAIDWANAAGVTGSSRGPSLDALTAFFDIDDRRQSSGGIHGAANDAWQTANVVNALIALAKCEH